MLDLHSICGEPEVDGFRSERPFSFSDGLVTITLEINYASVRGNRLVERVHALIEHLDIDRDGAEHCTRILTKDGDLNAEYERVFWKHFSDWESQKNQYISKKAPDGDLRCQRVNDLLKGVYLSAAYAVGSKTDDKATADTTKFYAPVHDGSTVSYSFDGKRINYVRFNDPNTAARFFNEVFYLNLNYWRENNKDRGDKIFEVDMVDKTTETVHVTAVRGPNVRIFCRDGSESSKIDFEVDPSRADFVLATIVHEIPRMRYDPQSIPQLAGV